MHWKTLKSPLLLQPRAPLRRFQVPASKYGWNKKIMKLGMEETLFKSQIVNEKAHEKSLDEKSSVEGKSPRI